LGVGLGALAIAGSLGGFYAGVRRGRHAASRNQDGNQFAMGGVQDGGAPMLGKYYPGPAGQQMPHEVETAPTIAELGPGGTRQM
jgi:hypothetical protein